MTVATIDADYVGAVVRSAIDPHARACSTAVASRSKIGCSAQSVGVTTPDAATESHALIDAKVAVISNKNIFTVASKRIDIISACWI